MGLFANDVKLLEFFEWKCLDALFLDDLIQLFSKIDSKFLGLTGLTCLKKGTGLGWLRGFFSAEKMFFEMVFMV